MIYKALTPFFVTGLLLSCATKLKNTQVNTVSSEEVKDDINHNDAAVKIEVVYVGVVEIDKECGVVIRVKTEFDEVSFAPSDFDERFKKEGMRVRFGTEDDLSKVKKCNDHFIISLTRITPLRQ